MQNSICVTLRRPRADFVLLRNLHFRRPWRSDGTHHFSSTAGNCSLRFPHFRHPWRSQVLEKWSEAEALLWPSEDAKVHGWTFASICQALYQ
jgi:hypothetical protein